MVGVRKKPMQGTYQEEASKTPWEQVATEGCKEESGRCLCLAVPLPQKTALGKSHNSTAIFFQAQLTLKKRVQVIMVITVIRHCSSSVVIYVIRHCSSSWHLWT